MSNPYPFPYMMPWGWPSGPQGPDPSANRAAEAFVPARVEKALDFVAMMTHKTAPRIAVNDITVEVVDGQELTDDEGDTLATACHLLSSYFAGRSAPDYWEKLRVEAIRQRMQRTNQPGRLMTCMACGQDPKNVDCPFCYGSGLILITPAGSPVNRPQQEPLSEPTSNEDPGPQQDT